MAYVFNPFTGKLDDVGNNLALLDVDRLTSVSTVAGSTLILTSDGTNQTLTGNLGTLTLAAAGNLIVANTLTPNADNTLDLGSTTLRFNQVFATEINSQATTLSRISTNVTAVSVPIGTFGFTSTWNRGSTPAVRNYIERWQYGNGTIIGDAMRLGYVSASSSILWLVDQDEGNGLGITGITESSIIAGGSNSINGGDTVGFRMLPNNFSGAIWFYLNGTIALDMRQNRVTFGEDFTLGNLGNFLFEAAERNTVNGNFRFQYPDNTYATSGKQVTWQAGLAGTDAQYLHVNAAIDYQGAFYTGRNGFQLSGDVSPLDGGLFVHGWTQASSASNLTGADLYLGTGPGTGNNNAKGRVFIQTPDLGASGTVVQTLSTKLTLARNGDITFLDGATLNFGATTGVKIGATTDKLSLYGATPIIQPSAYTQTYATADKTHANFTSADIGAFTGGIVGFLDAAERDNIRTQFNALRADVTDLKQLANSLIDDLQALGAVG